MQELDVKIESYELNKENLTACLKIRQIRENCVCPRCCKPLYGVKQWRKRELWGVPLGAFQRVKIIFYQLQAACGECLKLPLAFAQFIHPRFKTMTTAFAEYAGRWMEETTIAAVERMTSCSGMSLWRLDQWRMKTMKKMFEVPTDMPMSFASADEVHMRTIKPKDARFDKSKWKKRFITNLVSCDLKPSKKYVLVARKKQLSRKDQTQFEQLVQVNKNISNALILIEYFHSILDKSSVKEFRDGLKLWEELVAASKITQFEKFLETVKKHQSRIEAYISSKLTTAISEGLNNKIKVLKRVGYTYTNEESFKNKILQRCGFINSKNLNTNQWYWHVWLHPTN